MLLVDVILILALLGFAGAGSKDGFIHTLGRLIGAILGFIAAKAWYGDLGNIFSFFGPSGWVKLIVFLIIFIVVTRLVGFVFKLIDGAFRILSFLPFLKSINSLLGGLLGLAEGFVILGGAIYLLTTYPLVPSLAQWLAVSSVAHWISTIFRIVLGILL